MSQGDMVTLPSGARLFVSPSSWENAKALHDAVLREMRGKVDVAGLDLDLVRSAFEERNVQAFSHLLDKVVGIACSKDIENAIFACAEKAIYQPGGEETSKKVSRVLFNDPDTRDQSREDYYAIAYHVAEVNLRPFVKALSSSLKALAERSTVSRGSSAS
jgi:hypothetical protein